jgi:hypothetical protein
MNEPKYTDAQIREQADWERRNGGSAITARMMDDYANFLSERQAAMQGQCGDRNDIVNAIMRDACEADRDHPDDPETVCIATPALRLIVERHIIDAIQPPQPVRSVSDEEVAGAWMAYTGRDKLGPFYARDHEFMTDSEKLTMRAALEHFAAIAQEKQS